MKTVAFPLRPYLLFFAFLSLLFSCKQEMPKGVMDKGKMENLLYDYHLAQAMAAAVPADSVDYYTRLYCRAVYHKYGVTEEDFNRSMEWYMRHSEQLFKIYRNLDKRYADPAASAMAGSGGGPVVASGKDSINFWRGRQFFLLSSVDNGRLTFEQEADSLLRPGDRLHWRFNVRWMYREGMKSAIALLAVRYDNDSIGSVSHYLYGTGPQEIVVQVGDRKVKSIFGFVYQNAEWTDRPKFLVVSEPVLSRSHPEEVAAPAEETGADSLRVDKGPVRDSLSLPASPSGERMEMRMKHFPRRRIRQELRQ